MEAGYNQLVAMNDSAYRKRLSADLPAWRDAGWVTPEGLNSILLSVQNRRHQAYSLASILGVLGAILLGLGVIAFIGANWEGVPRGLRLGLIALALIVAYGTAFALERAGLRAFAEAASLAAGLVFAAAIALIGQTFHLAGDFSGAVMVFVIGILGASLMTSSLSLTALGLVGTGYWTWLGTVDTGAAPHWPSLAAMLIGLAITTWYRSSYGRSFAVLALLYWMAITIIAYSQAHHMSFAGGMALITGAALAIWASAAALASWRESVELAELGEAMLGPALLAVVLAVGVLQAAEEPATAREGVILMTLCLAGVAVVLAGLAQWRGHISALHLVSMAVITVAAMAFAHFLPEGELMQKLSGGVIVIAAALWCVHLGISGAQPGAKMLGLIVFGVEVAYIYAVTLGSLLDTALAFLVGGALFIVLAFALYRIDRLFRGSAAATGGRA